MTIFASIHGSFMSYYGDIRDKFAEQMTAKARQLGMRDTVFRNASGLPDRQQHTTARDMAVLGIRLRRDFPQYYSYFSTQSFQFNGRTIYGHNRLIPGQWFSTRALARSSGAHEKIKSDVTPGPQGAYSIIMSHAYDIDQAGNVLCTYTDSEEDGLKVVRSLVAPPSDVTLLFLLASLGLLGHHKFPVASLISFLSSHFDQHNLIF